MISKLTKIQILRRKNDKRPWNKRNKV